VALLADYDSRWTIGWQKHTEKYDQLAILKGYYHAMRKLAQSIDMVNPDVSLQAFKLVVAPDLYLIPKERAEHLLEYVKNGEHLVLGPRSGLKDEFSALIPLREPGIWRRRWVGAWNNIVRWRKKCLRAERGARERFLSGRCRSRRQRRRWKYCCGTATAMDGWMGNPARSRDE
jgi:beta-galactosidase GanA